MQNIFNWLSTNSLASIAVVIIVSILILSVIVIYLVAFKQGREISFWPPRIGTKPISVDSKHASLSKSSYENIKDSLNTLIEKIKYFSPDILICFDRSSAIFGGMLAQNLHIASVIVLNRTREKNEYSKVVIVGEGMKLDNTYFNEKKVMIFAYNIGSTYTLKSGLSYLEQQKINIHNMQIAAIYVSKAALRIYTNIIYVKEENDPNKTHENLPWLLTENYDYQ